jgi:putative phosphoserine phosphatase/1-acylglycerol-3-phosphate O-acyltransferase
MFDDLTRHVAESARGPRVGAFFDLDRTLLEGFSAYAFLGERLRSGAMPPREMLANLSSMLNYSLGRVGFSGVVGATTLALRGISEAAFDELGEQVFRKHLLGRIFPEAKTLVKAHRQRGHTLAIVSSATRYQIEPVARYLGIDHVLCTRLEVENGLFTGNVIRPTCYGEGKAIAGRTLADEEDLDLQQSFFYTDAHEDLPLLEIVGKPYALNPDRELAQVAAERKWPIRRFTARKTGLSEVLGTGAAYASMIPAVLAGRAVSLLTGSRRSGANLTMSSWADVTSAAIGLDLRVSGRENLWSHRPAVFVFNHQSAADAPIMAKLLREDFTGIAKKELSRHPIAGPMFKSVGVVFVERADREKALKALEPAVEALKKGTSLVIAPEGTRSETEQLGPFKKGAFHMAMQAGVPVVPVVIHNALDAQPKGEVLFRPATVLVEVLDPVSTSGWRPETIDVHVAQVRNLFLEALGQSRSVEPSGPETADTADQGPAKSATKRRLKTETRVTKKGEDGTASKTKPGAVVKATSASRRRKSAPKKTKTKAARRGKKS